MGKKVCVPKTKPAPALLRTPVLAPLEIAVQATLAASISSGSRST